MLIDDYSEFADSYDAGAAAVSNETVNMGDVIDLGSVTRDVGRGTPLWVVFNVEEAFADTSSGAGLIFSVVSDSTSTPSVDGSQTIHVQSNDFADTDLTAGRVFSLPLPEMPSTRPYERYLGVQLTNDAADALSAGIVSAHLSLAPAGDPIGQHFPDAAN